MVLCAAELHSKIAKALLQQQNWACTSSDPEKDLLVLRSMLSLSLASKELRNYGAPKLQAWQLQVLILHLKFRRILDRVRPLLLVPACLPAKHCDSAICCAADSEAVQGGPPGGGGAGTAGGQALAQGHAAPQALCGGSAERPAVRCVLAC